MLKKYLTAIIFYTTPYEIYENHSKPDPAVLFTYLFSYLKIHIQNNTFTALAPGEPAEREKKQRKYATIYAYLFSLIRLEGKFIENVYVH